MKTTTAVVWQLALALVGFGAAPAAAQEARDLQVGVHVQVSGDHIVLTRIERYWLRGSIVSTDSTHLYVRRTDTATVDTLPFFAIRRLEVSTGTSSWRETALKGGLIGGAIGAVVTLLIHSRGRDQTEPNALDDPNAKDPLLAWSKWSIPVCALLGTLIGAANSGEQWQRVHVPGALYPDP